MSENSLYSLNRVFTRNMLHHFIEEGTDKAYSAAVRECVDDADGKTNGELLSGIYSELGKHYRNEYYYKNTLLNKLLLGVHSVNTTTALTEVPIARSKADFVLINGKAVVYEIKTELDNLERLSSQIDDYYKAFDHVAVVTYEKNVSDLQQLLLRRQRPVGIYVLRRNDKIGIISKPQRYAGSLDKETIFKILRKDEFEEILSAWYGLLPNVSQFRYYTTCKEMFEQIPIGELYPLFLKVLKQRVHIEKEMIDSIPYELRFLAYFMRLNHLDCQKLDYFLNSQYGGA